MAITFGSLFAGIGGLDLGLERAGMTCKWQVEIDDYATRVLERHWPNVRRWRDITTFPPDTDEQQSQDRRKQETSPWNCDLICGGFPCQDISFAGKGAGLSGERSGLFFEAMRVVRILRPRYVLLENVAALLSRGLPDVLGSLASFGYDTEWHCIPAASVGAPHIRDRVFIVGYMVRYTNSSDDSSEQARSEQNTDASGNCIREAPRVDVAEIQTSTDTASQRLGVRFDTKELWQFASTVGASQWSTEPDVGRVANGIPSRVDRLKCLGNAVVPQVAEYIGRQIMRSVISDDVQTKRRKT